MDMSDGMDMGDGVGMDSTYEVPLSLTVLSGVFLALGALGMLFVAVDIVLRQGWKTMMWIMIPTYIINAGYMPLGIYAYWRYGRPPKPGQPPSHQHGHQDTKPAPSPPEKGLDLKGQHHDHGVQDHGDHDHGAHDHGSHGHQDEGHHSMQAPPETNQPAEPDHHEMHHNGHHHHQSQQPAQPSGHHAHGHMHGSMEDRPMWATVAIGAAHCGAGCILGDLVGEWLVYGTGAMIRGHDVWPALLIDYAFALLFGIVFQYFSIAPMSGEYGPGTVWRAAKADVLSLTSFEVGLFGWMVIYQVAIWNYQLEMTTWLYWWMMQVGMVLGYFTSLPVNWWLLANNIKEPCA